MPLLMFLAALAGPAQGQTAAADEKSSIAPRDTLIESLYRVEHKPLRAGFAVNYGLSPNYDANFGSNVIGNDCNFYSVGNGNLFGLLFLADIPFWGDNSQWTFRPSLYAEYHRPQFDWIEADSSYDSASGLLRPFSIRHEVQTTVGEAGIGGTFSYEIVPRWHVEAGANIGATFEESFTTSLHVIEPGNVLQKGSDIRDLTTASGSITKRVGFIPAISFGMNFDAPLSRVLWAEPGVSVSLPMGGQSSNGTNIWSFDGMSEWRGVEFAASLALLFDLTPRYETVPIYVKREIPEQKPETVFEAPTLTASIHAVAMAANGTPSDVVRMTVEEIRTRNADPILNYVFFDAGESSFPKRYVTYVSKETAESSFQGSSERHDISLMALYRETLNVVGDRLKKFPRVRIDLAGSTDNADDRTMAKTDAALLALARARAETVKRYLVDVWGIDPLRISISGTLLPDKPSPSGTEAGREENRRVEIRIEGGDSAAFRLLKPVIVTNIEHLATPDRIVLEPTVSEPISRSYATISANGVTLESFRTGATNSAQEKIWDPSEETLQKLIDSLDIDYDAWDSSGNRAHAHSSIPLSIVRVTSDRPERIERFSLILFGFDESELGRLSSQPIGEAVSTVENVPVKRVLIQGFTDEMGDPAHNDELSADRAENVRSAFEHALRSEGGDPSKLEIHAQGLGSRELPYDNSLPEGRFFSRTVTITIEREP